MSRHRVCRMDELKHGAGREFVVAGRVLAVFHLESGIHAIEGICPHAGGPLAEGMVRGNVVTCPWHGWQFNVTSGAQQLNPRICTPCFKVTTVGEEVYVEIPDSPGGS